MTSRPPLVGDLLELAAVPAPTFEEEARIEWLRRRLASEPGRRRRDDVGNLIWEWGTGRPILLLLVHVDTVFAQTERLEYIESGGRLVGPGIGDNAAAVVVTVDAVSELLARGPRPGAVAFTVGEEGLGNLRGANAACALDPAAAIAIEGHGLEHVIVDAIASIRARVQVRGPGGHSWQDRRRPSAIHALIDLASDLLALHEDEAPVNVGLVAGGEAVNAIAAHAELTAEMRSLDDPPLERFESALGALTAPPPLTVTAEILGRRPGGRLDRWDPLLRLVRGVRAELGLPDSLDAGSTDANAALARGIPALTLGVARGGNMHSRDEWIETQSLQLGRKQLELVLAEALA